MKISLIIENSLRKTCLIVDVLLDYIELIIEILQRSALHHKLNHACNFIHSRAQSALGKGIIASVKIP